MFDQGSFRLKLIVLLFMTIGSSFQDDNLAINLLAQTTNNTEFYYDSFQAQFVLRFMLDQINFFEL